VEQSPRFDDDDRSRLEAHLQRREALNITSTAKDLIKDRSVAVFFYLRNIILCIRYMFWGCFLSSLVVCYQTSLKRQLINENL